MESICTAETAEDPGIARTCLSANSAVSAVLLALGPQAAAASNPVAPSKGTVLKLIPKPGDKAGNYARLAQFARLDLGQRDPDRGALVNRRPEIYGGLTKSK